MAGMAGLGEEEEEEEGDEGGEGEVRNRLNGDLSTSTGSLLHSSISPFEEEVRNLAVSAALKLVRRCTPSVVVKYNYLNRS